MRFLGFLRKPRHYISLAEASRLSPYSLDYLSLRARQGKLKAEKIGRDWVTTREWLAAYIRKHRQTPFRAQDAVLDTVRPRLAMPQEEKTLTVFHRLLQLNISIFHWPPKIPHSAFLFLVIFLVSAIIIPLVFFKVLAQPHVARLFASECDGEWDNPEKAEREPEIGPEGAEEEFSLENSAQYISGPLFLECGSFDPLSAGRVKSRSLGLSLAVVSKALRLLEAPEPGLEQAPIAPEPPPTPEVPSPPEIPAPEITPQPEVPSLPTLPEQTLPTEPEASPPSPPSETPGPLPETPGPSQEPGPPSETPEPPLGPPQSQWQGLIPAVLAQEPPAEPETEPAPTPAEEPSPEPFDATQGKPFDATQGKPAEAVEGPVQVSGFDQILRISVSLDQGQTWNQVGIIDRAPLSNALNNGYVMFDLPDALFSAERILQNIQVRIEGLVANPELFEVYIDSVFIEVLLADPREAFLESEFFEFAENQEAAFRLRIEDKKDLVEYLPGVSEEKIEATLRIFLLDAEGNIVEGVEPVVKLVGESTSDEAAWEIEVPPRSALKPGRYKIRIFAVDPEQNVLEAEKEFIWGVLAINPQKSIFLPHNKVNFAFAVLDEKGNMVCNAVLTLTITKPNSNQDLLSTVDGSIVRNPECEVHGVTARPDYEAEYQLNNLLGDHKLDFKAEFVNKQGIGESHSIQDKFEVREAVPFDITRIGPTRILPSAPYQMRMRILANESYTGLVTEPLPKEFVVTNVGWRQILTEADSGLPFPESEPYTAPIVTWNVDFEAGQTYELGYTFDAPDISPQFWLLGPLRFAKSTPLIDTNINTNLHEDIGGNLVGSATADISGDSSNIGVNSWASYFSEIRRWQIAADAVAGPSFCLTGANVTGIGTAAWGTPGNACGAAPSDNVRSVAAVPKNGSSNWHQATNFGFSLPADAQINGITVEWEKSEGGTSNGGIKDNAVRIVKGGVIGATDRADTATFWPAPASEAFKSYGSATDLWGETWTAADINATNFGAALSALDTAQSGGGGAEDAQIDAVRITVDYSTPNFEQFNWRWRNDDNGEGGTLTKFLHPTSQGFYNQWTLGAGCTEDTGEWDCLNDQIGNAGSGAPGGNDGDTSYLIAAAAARSSFGLDNSMVPVGATVTQLAITITAGEVAAGGPDPTIRTFYRLNSIDNDCGTTTQHGTTSYTTLLSCTFSGLSLTATDLDNLEIGIAWESTDPKVTQLYVEITYTTTSAGWKAAQNTAVTGVNKCSTFPPTQCTSPNENVRVRFTIDNNGDSFTNNYRLQVSPMTGTCDAAGTGETYVNVPTATAGCGTAVACSTTSTQFTNQADTTDLADANGVTDPAGSTFVTGRMVQDPGVNSQSETNPITLALNQFTEVEYNFQFTTNAADNTDYCFRTTRSGTALTTYTGAAGLETAQIKTAAAATFTVAGNAYEDETAAALVACDGVTSNVAVSVNGGIPVTGTCADATGAFSIDTGAAAPAAGTPIFLWVDGATCGGNADTGSCGSTVIRYSGTGNITTAAVRRNRLIVRHDDATAVSNANLGVWDNVNDADIVYDVDASNNLTVEDNIKLIVNSGDGFTPGATVTTSPAESGGGATDGDILIESTATLTMASNALSVGGGFANSGTFSKTAPQTATFTATTTGHTIDLGTGNFDNVTFNGASGGWSFPDASNTIDGDLTMTAGTLSGTTGLTVNGGDVTGDGTINLTGGTFTINTLGNLGGATAWTFSGLTIGAAGNATTTATGAGGMTVTGVLTIDTGDTLNAGSKTWTLSGSGTPFVINGTFTASTSTINYTATAATNITATTYNNLGLSPSGAGSPTFTLGTGVSQTITVNGNLTVGDGTNAVTVTAATNDPTLTVSGTTAISVSATLTQGAGTHTLTGAVTVNGTLNGADAGTIEARAGVSGSGTVNVTGGTFEQRVSASQSFGTSSGATSWTFNNLTFSNSNTDGIADVTISMGAGTGGITVNAVLTIARSADTAGNQTTLNAGSRTWTLSGPSAPFVINGQGVFTASTSTVVYNADAAVTITVTTYNNLTLSPTITAAQTYTAGGAITANGALDINPSGSVAGPLSFNLGGATTVSGATTIRRTGATATSVLSTTASSFAFTSASIDIQVGATLTANGSTITVTGPGTPFTVSGTFTVGTSTFRYTGTTATNITATTYNNLQSQPAAIVTHTLGTAAAQTITVNGNLTVGDGTNAVTVTAATNNPTLDINGDVTINASAILTASGTASFTVGANWSNSGTFTHSSGTVTFDSTITGRTIAPGASNFNNVTFNGTGGGWSVITNPLTVAGNLTMTAGTLSGSAQNITVNGNVACGASCGTITLTGATFEQRTAAASNFGTNVAVATEWTFFNLTFSASTASTITFSSTGTGNINVTGVLTVGGAVAPTSTVNFGNRAVVLSGAGTPFSITANGVFTPSTSTVQYTGGAATNIAAATYNNLSLLPSVNAITFTLGTGASQTITANANITIGNGTNTGTITAATNNPILDVLADFTIAANAAFTASGTAAFSVGANWSNASTATFTHSSGTVTFDSIATGRTIADGGDPFFNITFNGIGGGWLYQDGSATAPNATTVQNGTVTYLNTKTGTVSVTGGTFNVDWYISVHAVDKTNTATNIDTAANEVTISEAGSNTTVFEHDGAVWTAGAASQQTETLATGHIPQPNSAGAIRVRELAMTASATCPGAGCTLYRYNLAIAEQAAANFGDYSYFRDQGSRYITSCRAGPSNVCSNDTTNDDVIDSNWYRATIGTENAHPAAEDDPPTTGAWFVGMVPMLQFSLSVTSVNLGELNPINNFTNTTGTVTTTFTTSASSGAVVRTWSTQAITRVGGTETIADWTGTNTAPSDWPGNCPTDSQCGFGYNTNDSSLSGGTANRFTDAGTCGADSQCWAGFGHAGPGDPVADSTGQAINQPNIVTFKISTTGAQTAGEYSTVVIFVCTAQY